MGWLEDAIANKLVAEKTRRKAMPLSEKMAILRTRLLNGLGYAIMAFVAYSFILGPMVGPRVP